jgi:hypothetical protein
MAKSKSDPTVTSERTAESSAGWHPARPVEEADDWAGSKKYKEMPGKPDPSTVAQVEVLPEDE